jgi:4-amino-4-deoxy-L-arabinose transferase-like glycosyltransferase
MTTSKILDAPGRLLDAAAARPPAAILAIHLLAFLALALPGLCRDSCTFDEGMHLVAGYAGLTRGDFRLSPDNPPLGRMLSALPLLLQRVQLPEDPSLWRDPAPWDLGFLFLYQSGNNADRMLLQARLPVLLWSLMLLAMVFFEARRIAGPRGGVLALTLATFNPTLLAHGHLCTTDVLSTMLIFAAVGCLSRFLQRDSLPWAAAAGVLSGAALATKFSALCLVPVFGILAVAEAAARIARRRSAETGPTRFRPLLVIGGGLGLLALAYGSVWAAYGFRFRASADPAFSFDWTAVADPGSVLDRVADAALRHRLLPESFLYGFKLMQSNTAHGHPTYALGMHATSGWKWYLPLSFLVKTPISSLILMAWGAWAWLNDRVRAKGNGGKTDPAAMTVLAVYGLLAIGKNMTIGLRHLLPMHPFLALQSAAAVPASDPQKPPGRWAPALLAVAILETVGGAPHFVGYFNSVSGALAPPHEFFVDSNLDWGQDLAG